MLRHRGMAISTAYIWIESWCDGVVKRWLKGREAVGEIIALVKLPYAPPPKKKAPEPAAKLHPSTIPAWIQLGVGRA